MIGEDRDASPIGDINAFDLGKGQSLGAAMAAISTAGSRYEQVVITPTINGMTAAHAKVAPSLRYDPNVHLLGEDLWIAQVKIVLKRLARDSAHL